jgi:hypothetical protein
MAKKQALQQVHAFHKSYMHICKTMCNGLVNNNNRQTLFHIEQTTYWKIISIYFSTVCEQ